MSALLGKKVGMTGVFDEGGQYVPVTVVQLGPNYIAQVKTKETDGYDAVQLGFEEKAERKVTKPEAGHLDKAGVPSLRYIKEVNTFDAERTASFKPGAVLKAEDVFAEGDTVHVVSTSKGRGFQGVVKRHHFGGVGQQTHGQSDRQRAPGSIGASSYPSRVFKGQRMGGRMGGNRITTRNLTIVRIIPEQNLIMIKGSIAGAKNQLVQVVKG
jgi:large subunit ribosomal protein L3